VTIRWLAALRALGITCTLAQLTVPATTAVGSSTPLPHSLSWLAAGDSYSSGEGLPHSTGKCAQADPLSGSQTWAQQAYQDLSSSGSEFHQPDLVACTGAPTSEFMNADDAAGHAEWAPSMGRFDLATFTFGGDDIGFVPIIEQCIGLKLLEVGIDAGAGVQPPTLLPSAPGHLCPRASIIEARIAALGGPATQDGTYRYFLTQVANDVIQPGGNIVVLGYPEIVELPQFWPLWAQAVGACWGIGPADALELRGLAGDLNATIGSAVADVNRSAPNGVHLRFMDVNTVLKVFLTTIRTSSSRAQVRGTTSVPRRNG
jgi:hypothetical protein